MYGLATILQHPSISVKLLVFLVEAGLPA